VKAAARQYFRGLSDGPRSGTGEEKAPSRQTFNISRTDKRSGRGVHAPTATCHNAPEQSGVMTESNIAKNLSGIPAGHYARSEESAFATRP
jgi:hypothetical protein